MPALNVTFTDAELEQLRASASGTETSLKAFVHDAALAAANDRKRMIAQLAQEVAATSAELNARLA